jgi:hypothetical protein
MPKYTTNSQISHCRLTSRQSRIVREYLLYTGRSMEEVVREAMEAFIECSVVPRIHLLRKKNR